MGTKFKGTEQEINALNVYIKLSRALGYLNSKRNLLLAKRGLSESQFSILDALFYLGPLSQSQLAKKIFRSGGNITMVIDNLEKNGYVNRKRGSKDRRVFEIHITSKGKNLFKKAFPEQVKIIADTMSALTEDEQIEMERHCKKIGFNSNSIGK